MLIVDETHRLLKDQQVYRAILSLSKTTPNALFLSATPIQDRREEYHRLLTLLGFVNLILFDSKQTPHLVLLHNNPALHKKHSFLHSKAVYQV